MSFNFMASVTICSDLEPPKIKSLTVSIISPSICHNTHYTFNTLATTSLVPLRSSSIFQENPNFFLLIVLADVRFYGSNSLRCWQSKLLITWPWPTSTSNSPFPGSCPYLPRFQTSTKVKMSCLGERNRVCP